MGIIHFAETSPKSQFIINEKSIGHCVTNYKKTNFNKSFESLHIKIIVLP